MSWKRFLLKCVAFLLIFSVLFYVSQEVLTDKWDVHSEKYRAYIKEPPETLDVLFIGTSHFFMAMNPMIMWKENGIASFNLSMYANTPFLNYQQLLFGLETQTPKVVVMDFNSLCQERRASSRNYEYTVRYVHDSLPFRRQQLAFDRALYELEPDVDILSFYFPLLCYHTRWDSLKEVDFVQEQEGYLSYSKGTLFNQEKIEEDFFIAPPYEELIEQADPLPVSDYTWSIYERIIDLCQEKGISLVLLTCPEILTEEDAARLGFYRAIEKTSEDLHLNYYNLNSMDFWEKNGLCKDDFYDRGHLNWRGSIKFSAALADILQRDYAVPDHRGDPAYDAWENEWDLFYRDQSEYLAEFGY